MITTLNKSSAPTVGVAFITHNAEKHLPFSLPPILNSAIKPRVVVVNSSSQDKTVEIAKELGAETLVIPRKEFNHGSTREKARKYLGTDIVVMMTPDAYATDEDVLEKLIDPIIKNKASISYARQVPHDGAKFFESFPREYNYPMEGHIRGIGDVDKFGVYTFFCSDSCAAYKNDALEDIGGFQSVLTGEDTVAAAKLLARGHKISYTAEAVVKHSHHYSLFQEFKRMFDTGLARREYQDLLFIGGKDTVRGKKYVREMINHLVKEKPQLIPYALSNAFFKWIGYRAGRLSANAPVVLKKTLSGQKFYWESNDFLKPE